MQRSIWIGWDRREAAAFAVARESCRRHLTAPIPIYGLLLDDLIKMGLYTRPIEYRPSAADKPIMWDVVSDHPQSTDHANARFFLPHLAKKMGLGGWALFVDGDVMFRGNVCRLFEQLEDSKALYCVHHDYAPVSSVKMDNQVQSVYARKNQSSVMAVNLDHPANKVLTLEVLNTTPGRDLHRFCWLNDSDIGELDQAWNYLVGHTAPELSATICHFTSGTPDMDGYSEQKYADEWRMVRDDWARGPLSFGS
jgi:lipopolysaccharide biosynthesis glycosyltransferase